MTVVFVLSSSVLRGYEKLYVTYVACLLIIYWQIDPVAGGLSGQNI